MIRHNTHNLGSNTKVLGGKEKKRVQKYVRSLSFNKYRAQCFYLYIHYK